MRSARVGDFRRKIVSDRDAWLVKIASFTFDQVPGLGSGHVTLNSPLILLTGPNGVGKSTLTKCIRSVLCSSGRDEPADSRRSSGSLKVEGVINGVHIEKSLTIGIASEKSDLEAEPFGGTEIIYLDCARDVMRLQRVFSEFSDIEDITNGISPIDLSNDDLSAISRIVGRDYRSVTAYEIDVDGTAPFFEVAYGPASYTSITMGDGEHAALLIWWTFWRAANNSVIILEEPESFLSAACQRNLGEFILSTVVSKRLVCIASSHSPHLMEVFPPEAIRFFARTNSGVRLVDGDPPPVLLKSIGISLPRRGQLFVEDSSAKAFIRLILEKFNTSLSRSVGISVSGGEGEIREDLKRFNRLKLDLLGVGVFDGDIAASTLGDYCTRLPGEEPVEVLFRRCAQERIERLIDLSGSAELELVLQSLEGKDHHDWFEEFARESGLDKGQAFNLLFRLWIEVPTNAKSASDVAEQIANLLP